MLGYTMADLKRHIERQFVRGMNWQNYGRGGWHIDHITPVSHFKIVEAGDAEFRACWALANLRPLWEPLNNAKKNKRTHLI